MEFDLISAYSSRISWASTFKPSVVECSSEGGFYEAAKCEEGDLAIVVVNLEPSIIQHTTSETGEIVSSDVTTCSESDLCLQNLYQGLKTESGEYDT